MAAGAAALIVGYPDKGPGEIYRPTLIEPTAVDIPVVSVTGATVELLRDEGEARIVVETERAPSTIRNVIAELGSGPSVIMLGAHLDSVLDGPGINDNGSGVVTLLEVARGLAASGVPEGWTVRIGLWGAEELGSIGSRAYASDVGDEVRAYLNLDMTGSVNGANLVYAEPGAAPGSEAITEAYEAWFAARGIDSHRADLGGASDHNGFIQAGIPTGGLFAGATESGGAANPSAGGGEAMDPCYHLACDTVDNVDLDRVALFADATQAVVLELMQTWDADRP
jgi:Zn-dependent M28 family amino/carboxypeptidase